MNKHKVMTMSSIERGNCSGIYILLDDGIPVYVGQSGDVHKRIMQHLNDGSKIFNSFSFIPVMDNELDDIESMYILRLKPKYNSRINGLVSIENLLTRVKSFSRREITMGMMKVAINRLKIPEISFKGRKLYRRSNDGVLAFASLTIFDGGEFDESFMTVCRD